MPDLRQIPEVKNHGLTKESYSATKIIPVSLRLQSQGVGTSFLGHVENIISNHGFQRWAIKQVWYGMYYPENHRSWPRHHACIIRGCRGALVLNTKVINVDGRSRARSSTRLSRTNL